MILKPGTFHRICVNVISNAMMCNVKEPLIHHYLFKRHHDAVVLNIPETVSFIGSLLQGKINI